MYAVTLLSLQPLYHGVCWTLVAVTALIVAVGNLSDRMEIGVVCWVTPRSAGAFRILLFYGQWVSRRGMGAGLGLCLAVSICRKCGDVCGCEACWWWGVGGRKGRGGGGEATG